jgi:beta-glucuronidase
VFVNGVLFRVHVCGCTPFNFEVTDQVRSGENVLIVKVDNRRRREGVPTLNTDWWNYGGLTRDVWLLDVPATFIRDYSLKLASRDADRITGWVQLDGAELAQRVTLRIPEAAIEVTTEADAQGFAKFDVPASLELWCCERPKLYAVEFSIQGERIEDRIGFRTLETRGHDILLNGVSVFLRGISLHEQAPRREGRAVTRGDAETLLGWAQELDVNFVRLAHYPHHEHTARLADELGLLLWAEIPVYWTIDWENPETLANAKNQLEELVVRDKNRASVVIWSVGNETPIGDARNRFMAELVASVRALDDSRLVSAALERRQVEPGIELIDDPLGALLDVVGCNEYLGWYDGLPDKADSVSFQSAYDKPLVISEFGADALYGYHADALTRWSEEYQANVYTHQIAMLERIPFLRGVTPWILTDFRSPRRPLPQIQDFWNRKGLISDAGQKKQAFFVLKEYYQRLIARFRG